MVYCSTGLELVTTPHHRQTCPGSRSTAQADTGHPRTFSRAQQEHRDASKDPLPAKTLALIAKVTRSINRGIGQTPLKDSFELELLHSSLPVEEKDPGYWYRHTDAARDITTLCCWWLLRGIENAAAKMKHVWRQTTSMANTTYFTLPIQKSDKTGICVSVAVTTAATRTIPTRFCPHCAMVRHEKRVRYFFPQNDTVPFMPKPDGSHPSTYRSSTELFNPLEQSYPDQALTVRASTDFPNTFAEFQVTVPHQTMQS